MQQYAERLAHELGAGGFALVGLDCAGYPSSCIGRCAKPLTESSRHCSLGVFLGNARHTGFGVHREPDATLACLVAGEKRLRLWSEDARSERGRPISHGFFNTRYDDLWSASTLLQGAPGEAFYWPSHYAHIAERTDSLSLWHSISRSRKPWVKPCVRLTAGRWARNSHGSARGLRSSDFAQRRVRPHIGSRHVFKEGRAR
jgi:hypothetical protein